MTSGVRSAKAASGTLGTVPLAPALIYIRNKRLSGVLELRASADHHAWVVFWRGLVISIMTTPTIARFGTVAHELGLIDEQTLRSTTREAAAAQMQRPQMDLLVGRGEITLAQREAVMTEQVRQRIVHLFKMPPETSFVFREGRPSTMEPAVIVDTLAPVWQGLKAAPASARAAETIERIGEHRLRVVSGRVVDLAELSDDEEALCRALARTPLTLAELRAETKLPQERVDLLVYFLVMARCVEVDDATHVPMPSSAMWVGASLARPVTPPSSQRISAAAANASVRGPSDVGADAIRRRAAALDQETPCATLGLPEEASAEAARAAYFRLSRVWNPDRLAPDLASVRREVAQIFARMTQCHRLLTDAPREAAAPRRR